tara:strand:+ start:135 stop:665 length:531 start_codon:yes stop_codon:yes gene_type:complete
MMFDKTHERWTKPKTFWYADIHELSFGDCHCSIHKIKIYGYTKVIGRMDKKNYLRLAVKRKVGSLSNPSAKHKLQMVYQRVGANCIDKDLSFVIEACIEAQKRSVKNKIQRLQDKIDDVPNYKKKLEDRQNHLKSILENNKIDKDNFLWSDRDVNADPKKLNISDKHSDDYTMYSM